MKPSLPVRGVPTKLPGPARHFLHVDLTPRKHPGNALRLLVANRQPEEDALDRKPVWINGRQIFVLPWARVWDTLLAAPPADFQEVWNGRALVTDESGRTLSPDDGLSSGQKLFIRKKERKAP
jgi:hypothetical protein